MSWCIKFGKPPKFKVGDRVEHLYGDFTFVVKYVIKPFGNEGEFMYRSAAWWAYKESNLRKL